MAASAVPSPVRALQDRCRDQLGITLGELHALVAVVVCDLYEHRAATYDAVTELVRKVFPDASDWAGQHLGRLERLGLLRSETRDGTGNRRFYKATERGAKAVIGWAGRWVPT